MRVSLTPNAPGTGFGRYVKGLRHGPEFCRAQFPDQPHIAEALTAMAARTTKAGVVGLTTVNQPDLATLGVLDAQAAQLLATDSPFEAARAFMPEKPFDFLFSRQTDAGTGGGYVGEGHAMPVIKGGLFDTVKFTPARLGSICVLTEDVLRRRGTEAIIRTAMFGAQGRVEAAAFLDPTVAATDGAPASITHGGTFVAWTGSPATTLAAMLASVTTDGRRLAWLGRLRDFAVVAAGLGGAADLPRTLLGLPAIAAPNAPSGQITLADFAEIPYAATSIEVDLSDEATLQMDSEPTNAVEAGSPPEPVPTQLVSLFQANAVAFKIWRLVNWLPREGSVAYTNIAGSPA